MKKLTSLFTILIFLTVSIVSSLLASGAAGTEIDGAGTGLFPSGATFNGVDLQGSNFGQGVAIYSSGEATGDFFTILSGTSALGAPQTITVTGVATSGSGNGGGSGTFSGISSVDMGDGSAPVSLPFSVTVTNQGLTLVLGTVTLPTQTLTSGGIDIQPW